MKRRGFSLIETLIYTGLLSTLAMVSFSWLATIIKNTHQMQAGSNQVMMAHAAIQRLATDVGMSDAKSSKYQAEPGVLQMPMQGATIGWRQEKDRLYRTENKSKALVATGLTTFVPRLIREGDRVSGVECTLVLGQFSLKHTMQVYHG